MSIKYIKENLKKFDHDNLISFLFDIVIHGGIDNVYDFDDSIEYGAHIDKVIKACEKFEKIELTVIGSGRQKLEKISQKPL